ncbi:outer membrane protein assembly factor BamE [Glaciimonas sp. Gout2]|uniref:outer membrane protein assembly factor BamE domain-containing protein n=1 Tax=unclassified Glaciimonas TaxID=2644401 RepID=UPI002B222E75|nr:MULTISPECIES: outer membrane protein assembly factor BamE [unclassified Glaciimonas]MEB0013140.1 outer membrane protein assembly factor BamE [Glaciimonas sp. Cout2]MEB0081977.1 outer membrane protein assembly factor BamE [Glaciimonas sp. Gout2]
MKNLASALIISLAVILAGCAVPVNPGDPETQVISRLGKPTATYQDGNERLLEYDQGAFGQETHMARISPDGRLISYTQVLTLEQFAKIKVGQSKNDVLRLVGHPLDTIFYSRVKLEGWNYGFKESGVWNSLMTVYFDEAGIVKKLENGPDPRFEHSRFGL